MNDAAAVGCGKCFGDLQTDQQRCFEFEWTTGDELAHVLALDKLHRDEMHAFDFVDIEDRADVRVVQRGGEPCLSFEAFEISLLRAELGRYHFNHDRASELEVGSFVNGTLPANTELVSDAIVAEGLADHLRHQRSSAAKDWINSAAVAVAVPTFPTTIPA